jgi:hypothetical protein
VHQLEQRGVLWTPLILGLETHSGGADMTGQGAGMTKLAIGDRFPSIDAATVAGPRIRIPDELEGPFTVLLLYRGHW